MQATNQNITIGASSLVMVLLFLLSRMNISTSIESLILVLSAVLSTAQTAYEIFKLNSERNSIVRSIHLWIGTAMVTNPITDAGLQSRAYAINWFVQTSGQGVAVGVLISVGLTGVVRTVQCYSDGEIDDAELLVLPSGRQLTAILLAVTLAVVSSSVATPLVSATVVTAFLSLLVSRDGKIRGYVAMAGVVAAVVITDTFVTDGLTTFVIVTVAAVVGSSLLPERPLHHVAFATSLGFVSGILVSLRTASLSGFDPAISLFPGVLFAGITLLISTVVAGLFNGPELIEYLGATECCGGAVGE